MTGSEIKEQNESESQTDDSSTLSSTDSTSTDANTDSENLKSDDHKSQESKTSDQANKSSEPAIETEGLTKIYGSFAAIRDVTFTIPKGQVVAFLGPNGAGKSTTMKIITGYMSATSGRAKMLGLDIVKQRKEMARHIGFLPENGPLYYDMNPKSFLQFLGKARNMSSSFLKQRIEYVVETCSLASVIGKPIGKLSKGYKQRVGMAQVMLHDPDVLIMDEPTSGLDPNQIRGVRDTIRHLGEEKTIMLSTHILQEVEAMADRVIFIYLGRIVFDGPLDEFRRIGDGNLDETFYRLTVHKE